MFLGHFGVALAAKRTAPALPLAALMAASQFIDLLWPALLITGTERVKIDPGNTAVTPLNFEHYPISHSLAMVAVWALAGTAITWLLTRQRAASLTIGALIASHWFLDALVHRPDLPLSPRSSTFVGLGLWNSVGLTVALELALFFVGIWIYATSTRPKTPGRGTWVFYSFVAFLLLLYATNLLGPPPPSVAAIETAGLAGAALLIVWAIWLDRFRVAL